MTQINLKLIKLYFNFESFICKFYSICFMKNMQKKILNYFNLLIYDIDTMKITKKIYKTKNFINVRVDQLISLISK